MIDVLILTSSDYGVAAHHLPYLLKESSIRVKAVIVSEGILLKKQNFYKNKLKKALKIGIFGTFNGFRMRKWYDENVELLHQSTALETQCLEHSIPFFRVKSTNSEATQQLFKEANVSVGISLGNGFISKRVFSIPKFGMINIHHEELPAYQNAQSIIWQIYNKSKETGFTIHKIDAKIDTGEVLYLEKVPIYFAENLEQTVSKTLVHLQNASAKGLVTVLTNFENFYANAKQQGEGKHYTTPSLMQFWKIYSNYLKMKKNNA
jgi:methionyl-tRNA formyltransferase